MLDIDVTPFGNLSECRQVGSQSIRARLGDGREIRVTAERELGADGPDRFRAEYEQLETPAGGAALWVGADDFPAAYGESVADCLHVALGWLNAG